MKHVFAIGRDVAPMRIVERAFAARFLVVKAEEIAQKLGALALRFQSDPERRLVQRGCRFN